MSQDQSLGKPQLSREEEADLALRNTAIRPRAAASLILTFLLIIFSVPVLQFVVETHRDRSERPHILQIVSLLPHLRNILSVRTPADIIDMLPRERTIREYEDDLVNNSILSEWILPQAQAALASAGAGNEQAYCGVESWLFYRPDVDYLTGPGFLEPEVLRTRARKGEREPVQADPIPAITRFKAQLKERGIELIVMPAPSKPIIQPEKLNPRFAGIQMALQNPSYPAFCDALRREGVRLFDPSDALIDAKRRTGEAQFLETDTHWTPAAMERVADALSQYIRTQGLLSDSRTTIYQRRSETAENLGDIALMLKLPQHQTLYSMQRVSIHPVYASNGEAWRPRRDADILLLGDSYSNIYSLDGMGWGKDAGFTEQLSFFLQRPLDRIVINNGGSYTTREQLLREIARGTDRLRGKRLVVWQFAVRDLMEGDWKRLQLPELRSSVEERKVD